MCLHHLNTDFAFFTIVWKKSAKMVSTMNICVKNLPLSCQLKPRRGVASVYRKFINFIRNLSTQTSCFRLQNNKEVYSRSIALHNMRRCLDDFFVMLKFTFSLSQIYSIQSIRMLEVLYECNNLPEYDMKIAK
jgi:hypothetical protein